MIGDERVTQSIRPTGDGQTGEPTGDGQGGPPPMHPTRQLPAAVSGGPDHGRPKDTAVTRMLCATTHLQGSYAEQVADTVLDPSFTAVAPSWGVDMVALTRHAMLAILRRRARDRQLRILLILTVVAALLAILTWPAGALSPLWSILVTGLVVMIGWAAAWQTVFNHYDLVRVSSRQVMDLDEDKTDLRVRDVAPPLDDPDVEIRLEGMAHTNVVTFGGYSPFAGDGEPLDTWTLSFDLEAAADWTGETGIMESFSVHDLYEHLIERVPPALGGIPAGKRLYVNGTAAKAVPGLVPDPTATETRPVNWLPQPMIDRYVDRPTETARTYVWFSNSLWNGDLVLTMLVRAEITGGRLFIEGRSHALLPLQQVFRDVKFVPRHSTRSWLVVARPTTGQVTPLWLSSVNRHVARKSRIRKFMRRVRKMRRDLVDGVLPINYGAGPSLREDAADAGELKYYATVDEVQRFAVMTRTVLDSMRTFLKERHIDLTQFGLQAEGIVHQTSVRLHPMKGAAGNFGKNVTVTVNSGPLS